MAVRAMNLSLVTRRQRMAVGSLESRIAPANFITVQSGGLAALPAGASSFADTGTYVIDPNAFFAAPGSVFLRANNDITFVDATAIFGAGATFSAQAGRSVTTSANGL